MVQYTFLLLPFIAFLAFLVKALTGFGTSIVVVGIGSLILPAKTIVVISAVLNVAGGGAILLMMRYHPRNHAERSSLKGGLRFWVPLTFVMVVGAVIGSLFLRFIPADAFRLILGVAILSVAVWFFIARPLKNAFELADVLPTNCSHTDLAVSLLAGIFEGAIGISGPLIAWHFGRRFAKQALRQTLIPMYFATALGRVTTYAVVGLIDKPILIYALVSIPSLSGIFVGNLIFFQISELIFSRVIGIILFVVAIKNLG